MTAAAARPRRELEPGRTVGGRYLVTDVLGAGGMGQVVRVEHVALGRPFALKVLRLEKWNDEVVRRFHREARALAKVTTPRVAQVTDFGVDDEVGPFYVMELLEGETLERRLEREGSLPTREALAICAEVCDALAEVHAAGIVHRDLKPSNVGLPRSGPVGVKLLDFGLAASMDDAFLSKITQSQQILGSLPYMAPEQFHSAEPAPAMDVYAVGVVLYEALVGRLPFFAPSTAAMIHQILSTPPPPLPAELPGRTLLEPLLERLLAKDARARFASAAAAAQALREAGAALGGTTSKSGHPPTRVAPEGMPPTAEGKAVPLAFMPTIGMPETGLVAESGTRLASRAPPWAAPAPVPPPAPAPMLPAMEAPAAGGAAPRSALPWLAAGLALALSAAAGVALVVIAGFLVRGDDDAPPAPRPGPPTTAPTMPAPPPPHVAPAGTPSEGAAPQGTPAAPTAGRGAPEVAPTAPTDPTTPEVAPPEVAPTAAATIEDAPTEAPPRRDEASPRPA
ncbi:MAG TPA: serine/threonine-protein kinase, partial [Sandaracinaceae bacterium]